MLDTASNSSLAQLNKAVAEKNLAFSEKDADELLAAGFLITLAGDLEKAKAGPVKEWETPGLAPEVFATAQFPAKSIVVNDPKEEEASRRLRAQEIVAQAEELNQKQVAALARAQEEKKRLAQEEKQKQEQQQKAEQERLQQKAEQERLQQKAEQAKRAEQNKQKVAAEQDATIIAEIKKKALLEERQQAVGAQKLMEEIKRKQQEETAKAQQAIELARTKAEEAKKQAEEARLKLEAERQKLAEEKKQQQETALSQQQLEEQKRNEELKKLAALQNQQDYQKQLEQQKAELLTNLGAFPLKRVPLLNQRDILLKQKDQLLTVVSQLVSEEERLAQSRTAIESQEQAATQVDGRHQLEQERWQMEEKIRLKEKEKWLEEEKLEKIQGRLQQAEATLAALTLEENSLKQNLAQVIWKLKEIVLREERVQLEQDLAKLKQQAGTLQEEQDAVEQQRTKLDQDLAKAQQQEQQIEAKAKEVGAQEKLAATPTEEQKIEKARWEVEEQRQKIEENRWVLETQQKNVAEKMEVIQLKIEKLAEKIGTLQKRLAEIEIELTAGDPSQPKPQLEMIKPASNALRSDAGWPKPPEPKPEPKPEAKLEPKPIPLPKVEPVMVKQPVVAPEKKMEPGLAPRKEIDTAAQVQEKEKETEALKKVKELKEQEEEKRLVAEVRKLARQAEIQEKIAALQAKVQKVQQDNEQQRTGGPLTKESILRKLTGSAPKEEAEREEFLARVAGKEKSFDIQEKEQAKEVVFRPVVMKPSFFEKFLSRFLVILIILVLVAAGVLFSRTSWWGKWFGPKNNVTVIQPEINNEENNNTIPEPITTETTSTESDNINATSSNEGENSVLPTRAIPPSLIDYASTKNILFTQTSDIGDRFRELLADPETVGTLARVVVHDMNGVTNEPLALDKTLKALGLKVPVGLVDNLEPLENLMLYYSRYGARLAVLAPVKDQAAAATLMEGWEASLPQDSQDLLAYFAAKPIKFSNVFKTATKYSRNFRYLDAADPPNKDLGLCYGFVNNYFVFTTSGSSIVELLRVIK